MKRPPDSANVKTYLTENFCLPTGFGDQIEDFSPSLKDISWPRQIFIFWEQEESLQVG